MGIKIRDIAYVRFAAPDLDEMEEFLVDFGLVRAERQARTLYMRGANQAPFLHVTHLGESGFVGVGFEAASAEDLERLADEEGVEVHMLEGPGGGLMIRLTDPDGFNVEVVTRGALASRLDLERRAPCNDAFEKLRLNAMKRLSRCPSHVTRLGHLVLNVSNFGESEAWYKSRFGLITSDEIRVESSGPARGAFLRCDRGLVPTDHHTLFLFGSGKAKFNHAAFEVADFDDLMCGHDWLVDKGRRHEWGVGRHILGSQIFDYWRDPWGHLLEHWTDGDILDAAWGSRVAVAQDLLGTQWGPPPPSTIG